MGDRNHSSTTSTSSHSNQTYEPKGTSIRSTLPSNIKSRTHKQQSKSNDVNNVQQLSKSDRNERKRFIFINRMTQSIQTFYTKQKNLIRAMLKILFLSSIIVGGIIFLTLKSDELFSYRNDKLIERLLVCLCHNFFFLFSEINCSIANAVSLL